MFGKRIMLFKLLGFKVHIDLSWLIIAVLITWSLAVGLFPYMYEGFSATTYWFMGALGAAGLFVSIVFHELFHSLVARRFGLPMTGITLFIFGGVAEMDDEPPSPKAEFFMAVAGPLSSVALSFALFAVYMAGRGVLPDAVSGVLNYLAFLNLILAGFNLLPAFPLDGGRVLRSILWQWKKNIRWATRISSMIGSGFGLLLIFMGILSLMTGNFIGGIWQAMIGLFLRSSAQASYRHVVVRKALEGETVKRFMNKDPVTVPPSLTINSLVNDYIYQYHYKMFPVIESGKLLGCITTRQVKDIPREEWDSRSVGDVAVRCAAENAVRPELDALKALTLMNRTGNSRLMVVDNGRLVGIISLKDIMGFLSVKLDLDETGSNPCSRHHAPG
jgi:Zn-dependent protease